MAIDFSAEIDYQIDAVKDLEVTFTDWRSPKARPIVRAFEKWERLYQQYLTAHFDSGGSGTWLPLAKSTRLRKARAGLDNGILIRTGMLRNALQANFKPRRNKGRITYSFQPVPKPFLQLVAFHQYGTTYMPSRPIVIPPDLTMRRRLGTIMGIATSKVIKGNFNG